MTDVIYDVETYKNVFSIVLGDVETRLCYTFEISDRKDQREQMIEFLRDIKRKNKRLVGFNNISFDAQILQFILKNQKCSVRQIYNLAQKLIKSSDDEKFKLLIPEKKLLLSQIDLYLLWHFNNRARMTSLKVLEFNMRSDDIEDLPYSPDRKLSSDEIDKLLRYNKHDMYQTFLFYEKSLEKIAFREHLTRTYKRDFMNHNDTKIGKDYFLMELENNGVQCREGFKPKQTIRDKIDLGECIFDYVQFSRPEFRALKDWIASQTITETKGVFTGILEKDLGELAQYANLRTKNEKLKEMPSESDLKAYEEANPLCWVEKRRLKSGKDSYYLCHRIADNLNCIVDGFQYDLGTGGIHGSVESQIVRDKIIVDWDVASFYPNLAIRHRAYPEHLTEKFCDIYEDIYEQRKKYEKGTSENAAMKLALNGSYGASNDKFSPFYDPKFTMTITINGQLSLCMLAEMLLEVPTLEMIQCNTDGLTYTIDEEYDDKAAEVCRKWEEATSLELERNYYSIMAIRDANSYIAVYTDGGVKRKGAYEYEREWHQNQSMLVVPKAAEAALVHDKDIEDFILNHNDIYDFMLRVKIPRSMKLVGEKDGEEVELQNTTRYYVSKEGYSLTKIMPPLPGKDEERHNSIQSGRKVTICNNINDYKGDIDYDFYIREAEKLVKPLRRSDD